VDFQKTEPGSDVSEPFVDCETAAVACRSRQGNWSIDGRNLAKNEIWLEEQDSNLNWRSQRPTSFRLRQPPRETTAGELVPSARDHVSGISRGEKSYQGDPESWPSRLL
jgi:hypothetical protein